MRPCKYDDKSARHHIKRLIQLLEQPTVLTTTGEQPKKQSRSRSNSNADDQQKPNEAEEKVKQNYDSFMQVIRQQQNKTEQLPLPERDQSKTQKAMQILKDLHCGAISSSSLKKLKHIKCIEQIQFSQTWQVPADRKVQGDLFYLCVRTVENPSMEHYITCTQNGFFRNDSTSTTFNPLPSTR